MRFVWIVSFLLFLVGIFFLKQVNLFANSRTPPVSYIDLGFFSKPSLEGVAKRSLEGTTGDYAFFIKNLKTGEEYFLNRDRQYEAGSLYKVWVMAVVFENIKNGKLKEDDVLFDNVASLNSRFALDSGFLELPQDSSIEISVKDAIYQMITISHNYSALLLLDNVRSENVSEFISEEGFSNSTIMGTPMTTAYDMGLFFEKLYKGEIVDKEYSAKMIEILKQQTLNGGIPKYLPQGVNVAHKTGDLGWFKHDAGIVFSSKGDYIFVALSESDNPPGAYERIALLSKAVYDYFVAN